MGPVLLWCWANTLTGAAAREDVEASVAVLVGVLAPKSELELCTGTAAAGAGLAVDSAFLPNKEDVLVPNPVVGVDDGVVALATLAAPPKRLDPAGILLVEATEAAAVVDIDALAPKMLGAAVGIGGCTASAFLGAPKALGAALGIGG